MSKTKKTESVARKLPMRKSIVLPGGSCDLRIGHGLIDQLGTNAASLVGKPRLCVLLCSDELPKKMGKKLKRQLIDAGFKVVEHELASGTSARDFAQLEQLIAVFSQEGLTADDLVVASGSVDALSLATHACGFWRGGITHIVMPFDLISCVEAVATPRGINVHKHAEAIATTAHPRMCLVDLDYLTCGGKQGRYARALMVQGAVADNTGGLEKLAGNAEALMAGDEDVLREQLAESVKNRGRIMANASLSVKQAINYGRTMQAALEKLLGRSDEDGRLLAEGLRFSSRLATAVSKDASVDLAYAQDALLDELGLEEVPCKIKPAKLIKALKNERFERTNRFMLVLPLKQGRVRLSTVDDELLLEHVSAWCERHAEL